MLRSLAIRDFVIVGRMELEFSPGFTVLSGETGAGKSILVDALALTLGARADAVVVRQGAERAEVSAEFDLRDVPACVQWLAANDLADEDNTCLVRRVIDAAGRSRGFINGHAATLAQLRTAGEFLLDIHGQHQHQSLARASVQRELLDAYGGAGAQAARVSSAFRLWREREARRVAFERDAAALATERAELEWQVREIEALAFAAEDWHSLNAEHARLVHAVALIEAVREALDALSEADDSALTRVNTAAHRLANLLAHDERLKAILDALEPARIELQEACHALRRYGDGLEVDPQRQREVEQRIDAVMNAARKFRVSPEELPQMLERARARLAELGAVDDVEQLRAVEAAARAEYEADAQRLTAVRRKAARKLSEEVTAAMQALAMAGGSLTVALHAAASPGAHGMEDVEFLVSPHKGTSAQALAKIASGGELSRISLAIQTATTRVAQVPTLIFDEVDAGIGGRVAEIVGRMMKALGQRHQVMCITHLPQVAASADHQWQVSKTLANGQAMSTVSVLDPAQRVEEIARMLGGLKITETTRRHAAEMLGMKR
ncbi:MAG TPA: DNA repair protein RecN [Burkholderiales bacterium]|nr:DNA repair protein RecN [Burkholderiales bacterium]